MNIMYKNKKYGHLVKLSQIPYWGRESKKGSRVVVTHPNKDINHQEGILGDWGGERNQGRYWVTLDNFYRTRSGHLSNKAAISTGCIFFLDLDTKL